MGASDQLFFELCDDAGECAQAHSAQRTREGLNKVSCINYRGFCSTPPEHYTVHSLRLHFSLRVDVYTLYCC